MWHLARFSLGGQPPERRNPASVTSSGSDDDIRRKLKEHEDSIWDLYVIQILMLFIASAIIGFRAAGGGN